MYLSQLTLPWGLWHWVLKPVTRAGRSGSFSCLATRNRRLQLACQSLWPGSAGVACSTCGRFFGEPQLYDESMSSRNFSRPPAYAHACGGAMPL